MNFARTDALTGDRPLSLAKRQEGHPSPGRRRPGWLQNLICRLAGAQERAKRVLGVIIRNTVREITERILCMIS
jgi:hypothetical protein